MPFASLLGLYDARARRLNRARQRSSNANSVNDGHKEFIHFRRLPTEIRMKIWKLAMPGERIFEPGFKTQVRLPDYWECGKWNDEKNQAPDPPTMTLRKKFKPPSLRAVCRESRQVSNETGGFKFGLMGGIRHGFWFNYNGDIVFLGHDMVHKACFLDLRGVSILAFSQHAFKTKKRCHVIFELIITRVTQCRVVEFHLQHLEGVAADNAKRYELTDNHEIGRFRSAGSNTSQLMKWGKFQGALNRAWDDYVAAKGYANIRKPRFVGFDMV